MGGKLGFIAASFIVAAFWLLMLAPVCAAQSEEPIGSEWVYSISGESPIYLTYSLMGTWTFSCERIVDSPIGDAQEESVEYHSIMDVEESGSFSVGYSFNRTMIASEYLYYDLNTSELIGYASNTHIDYRYINDNNITEDSYDELERTVYTPPGGYGTEPASFNVGVSWTKNYTKIKNISYFAGGEHYTDEHAFDETMEYTYLGSEMITVPAGTFSCSVFETASSEGWTETSWYAPEISGYVRINEDYGFGDAYTYELTSYHLEADSGSGTVERGSDIFIGAFFAFVVVTLAAAVYASIVLKKAQKPPVRKLGDSPPPPPDWS